MITVKNKRPRKRADVKSDLEWDHWKDLRKRKNIHVEYETIKIPYTVRRYYSPDYPCIVTRTGKLIFLEVKGYFRPSDRSKMRKVKQQNPDLDIRLVFAKDNKLNKKSRTTYSQWCEKNGFPYCIGRVPDVWFKE